MTATERAELTLAVANRLAGRERTSLLINLGRINVPEVPGCTAELLLAPLGDHWCASLYLCRPDCTSVGSISEVDRFLSRALYVVVGVAWLVVHAFSAEAQERWEVVTDALAVHERQVRLGPTTQETI